VYRPHHMIRRHLPPITITVLPTFAARSLMLNPQPVETPQPTQYMPRRRNSLRKSLTQLFSIDCRATVETCGIHCHLRDLFTVADSSGICCLHRTDNNSREPPSHRDSACRAHTIGSARTRAEKKTMWSSASHSVRRSHCRTSLRLHSARVVYSGTRISPVSRWSSE